MQIYQVIAAYIRLTYEREKTTLQWTLANETV